MRYKRGLVAGKFMPYHVGHQLVIERALAMCDVVDVLVVRTVNETWPAEQRANWIREDFLFGQPYEIHSQIRVHVIDNLPTDDSTYESSVIWAKYTHLLGFKPDAVFGSDAYLGNWAKELGCAPVVVDALRLTFPVSGTAIRGNFSKYSHFLVNSTKADLLPRIVIIGPESSGTTTLATMLGRYYATQVVPEYGRTMAEDAVKAGKPIADDAWTWDMFMLISKGQDTMEERLAYGANKLLICDTDSLSTATWWKRYNNDLPKQEVLRQWGLKQAQKHDLYLVTDYRGVPFTLDEYGTRSDGHRRWMEMDLMLDALRTKKPVHVLMGDKETRLHEAIKLIDGVLDDPVRR